MKPARVTTPAPASYEVDGIVVTRREVDDPARRRRLLDALHMLLDSEAPADEGRKP